jgi:hypothetical protein
MPDSHGSEWMHERDQMRHQEDERPLGVGEFVAHDSKLRFGRLNHGSAADLNIPYRRAFLSLSAPKADSLALSDWHSAAVAVE